MLERILRNIFSLLTGHVTAKAISFGCIILLARKLGVEGFGIYGTVMASLTLFAAFADWGMSTLTIRDIAQDYSRSKDHVGHVLILRIFLTTISYGFLVLIGYLWAPAQSYPLALIVSSGLFLFPEACRKLGISMLLAYERMDLVATMDVLTVIFRHIPFLTVIFLGGSLQRAFSFLAFFWWGVAAIGFVLIKKYCVSQWSFSLNLHQLRILLSESFPFGMLFVLSIIYFKADIIMLAKMKGSVAVGFYEGAYKFIEASMFLPTTIVNALLPIMARCFVQDAFSYQRLYLHSIRLLALGILPIVISGSFFSKEILLIVYGPDYLGAASAFSLLIWSLFFIFLNAPAGNVIATSHLMPAFLPYAIANTLLNIILNFLLIPKYSYLGASFTTVFTEFTGFFIQIWFVNRALNNMSAILWVVGKLACAAAITSLFVYAASDLSFFPFKMLVLLSTYCACVFGLQLLRTEDAQLYHELFHLLPRRP
ncbi:MAG: flippase [Candidatus Vecturithrix sp.]|jgi:O-antigen/teichoic acid export membrane protein|nr:flippase [Candidatus Vecturithrix sp.]